MTAIEEAREALARFDRGWRSTDELARALRALIAEYERLSVPPSDDDREALAQIVKRIAQKFGGPSMAEFEHDPPIRKHYATADAILRAGFRRQGPITDARPWRPEDGDTRCQVCGRRNPVWWANDDDWNALMPDDGILCPSCYHSRWLEAAERVRSAVPSTTEQESDR